MSVQPIAIDDTEILEKGFLEPGQYLQEDKDVIKVILTCTQENDCDKDKNGFCTDEMIRMEINQLTGLSRTFLLNLRGDRSAYKLAYSG